MIEQRLRIDMVRVTGDGLLHLEGWAATSLAVDGLQVFLGHRFLGLAELGVARADIGLAFPDEPRAARSGFRFVADVSSDDLSERTVHARTLLADGTALRASATLEVATLRHPALVQQPGIQAACEHVAPTDGGWSVAGWAASVSGISEVTLALDDAEPVAARIGLSRPDIGNRLPRIPSARQAGFAYRGPLPHPPATPRLLRVRIRAADGSRHTLTHKLAGAPKPAGDPEAEDGGRGVSRDFANRIKFFLDSPLPAAGHAAHPVRSALPVQGWAIARSGIEAVEILIDGVSLGRAYHGLRRPDIAAAFAEWPEAGRSGFALTIEPRRLTEGRHMIQIVVRDRAGLEASTDCAVVARPHAAPHAALRRRMRQTESDLHSAILAASSVTPRFAVVVQMAGADDAEQRAAQATLQTLQDQVYRHWHATILLPPGSAASAFPEATAAEPGRPLHTPDATHLLALRAGDLLGCDALLEFALEASGAPQPGFIYGDERRRDPTDRFATAVDYRPQWSPDLLLSTNYLGRSWCAAASLVEAAGATQDELYRYGGYDLALRLTERARDIRHVAKPLCDTSAAARLAVDGETGERAALRRALARRGITGKVAAGLAPAVHRVRRVVDADLVTKWRAVSVIMPTCASRGLFRAAIASVRAQKIQVGTGELPIELVAIDNIPAARTQDKDWLRDHADRVVALPGPFNWSRFNNAGAAVARGRLLLFLNDDIEAGGPGWLAALVEQALRPEIGVVGARLLYPDGKLQHVGIDLSPTGGLHSLRFLPGSYPGPFGRAVCLREASAVTGACMMVRREVFERLGGFDEAHAIINNDLDFCLRARGAGLAVVCTPYAELVHHELASRAELGEAHDAARFHAVCGLALARGDPYRNPNLSRFSETPIVEPEPTVVSVPGYPMLARDRVCRILALKLDHVGDFVTAFAAFRRLKQRFPAARLDVVCSPAAAALTRLEPAIDETIEFTAFHARSSRGRRLVPAAELAALAETLGGRSYDLAIDLRKHPETRRLLRASGATLLAGFDRDRMFPWLDVAVEWDADRRFEAKRRHVADDLLALVEAVAMACEPVQAAGAAAAWLAPDAALPPPLGGGPRICIHPGAGSAMKQWPPKHFAQLVDLLVADCDAEFILIGAADERRIGARVLDHVVRKDRVRSMIGRLEMGALPSALLACDLFVGNDSGPKHLAAALGIPTVGIHSGVVDPAEWGPYGPRAVAVHRAMTCSPCYLTKPSACPRELACLRQLLPADVARACRRLMRLPRACPTA